MQSARSISITYDEVTVVDNTSWIEIIYAMEGWERVPHLLHLSHVSNIGTASHLTTIIMHALTNEGDLVANGIASKVVCFEADGVSTSQGHKTGVTTQIHEKWIAFSVGVHYTSHRCNLAMETLFNFSMIARIESLLNKLHSYFCRSTSQHSKLQKLASIMETKDLKMLQNVTTRWISMRSPIHRVLTEYRTLIVKMDSDMTPKAGEKPPAGAVENFDMLVDVEVLLSLMCLMPLLNVVHCLIKFSQSRIVFMCNFLQAVKVCQSELAYNYIDAATAFKKEDFNDYHEILEQTHAPLSMKWRDMCGKSGINHLYLDFMTSNLYMQCHDKSIGHCLFVFYEELNYCVDNVERKFVDKFFPSFLNSLNYLLFKLISEPHSACR